MSSPPPAALPEPRAEGARPRSLLVTSALLVILAPAALAREAPWFAAWMLAAALIPLRPRQRALGVTLAYAALGYAVFSVVRVPFGGRVGMFLAMGAALGARVWALRAEAARRWS